MDLREIVSTAPREAFLRGYAEQPLKEGQVRVKVDFAAAKHGTEFAAFRGIDPHIENRFDDGYKLFMPKDGQRVAPKDGRLVAPKDGQQVAPKDGQQVAPFFMRPGNMYVGKVSELGEGVDGVKVGDRVAGYGPVRPSQTTYAGDVLAVPEHMSWKEAVCYDPAQFALGGVRDGQVRLGDKAAVFGLGAIGLMTAQMLKLAGASLVIVCDPIAKRRDVALANGADIAIDPANEDAGMRIKQLTGGRGADVIIEASGFYDALQAAIRGIAYSCNIAVVGWYHECHGGLDFGREAHFNRPNLIFSRACSEPDLKYPNWSFGRICSTCWDMLSRGMLKCENVVDPVVPFVESADAYMAIERDASNSVKLGVAF